MPMGVDYQHTGDLIELFQHLGKAKATSPGAWNFHRRSWTPCMPFLWPAGRCHCRRATRDIS